MLTVRPGKMMKRGLIVLALFFGTATAVPSAALASPGDCFLQVDTRTYLDGKCDIALCSDGVFTIGAGSRHFAVINNDPAKGTARGFWNGPEAGSQAAGDLGTLDRRGGCWTNARVKVCAWSVGARPATF